MNASSGYGSSFQYGQDRHDPFLQPPLSDEQQGPHRTAQQNTPPHAMVSRRTPTPTSTLGGDLNGRLNPSPGVPLGTMQQRGSAMSLDPRGPPGSHSWPGSLQQGPSQQGPYQQPSTAASIGPSAVITAGGPPPMDVIGDFTAAGPYDQGIPQAPASRYPGAPGPPADQPPQMPGPYGGPAAPPQRATPPPCPPMDSRQPQYYKRRRPRGSLINMVMIVGVLSYVCALSLPMFGAVTMLGDPSYLFWVGVLYPVEIICISVGGTILLILNCMAFRQSVNPDVLTTRALAQMTAVYMALAGLLLVFVSVPASRELYNTASRLGAAGCSASSTEAVQLVDTSLDLYRMKMAPNCFLKSSVEECSGFQPNKYTRYLKYLEYEFQCGPLCAELPMQLAPQVHVPAPAPVPARMNRLPGHAGASMMPSASSMPAANTGAVVEGAIVRLSSNESSLRDTFEAHPNFMWHDGMVGMLGGTYRVAKVKLGVVGLPSPDGSQGGVWYFPEALVTPVGAGEVSPEFRPMHTTINNLFSHGHTMMPCFPIVATRLKVLAWSFGDVSFWEGVGLLVTSLLASFGSLAGALNTPADESGLDTLTASS